MQEESSSSFLPSDDKSERHVHNRKNEENHEGTTSFQSCLHLLKGNIGPGCLSLPWAYSQLGITLSIICTVLVSIITSYNCLAMVRMKRGLFGQQRRDISYGDIGEATYGPRFGKFVHLCVCALQLSVCTVFFCFLGENISSVLQKTISPSCSVRVVMTAFLLPISLLSLFPNLKVLSPVTATGMILLLTSFVFLGFVAWDNRMDRPDELPGISSIPMIPLGFCAIMYSYEGICLVFPIESAMKDPKNFDNVYIVSMAIVCIIYAIVATTCVLVFGEVDNGSLSAFLIDRIDELEGKGLILATNFFVSLAVFVTYPLQLFPCVSLIRSLSSSNPKTTHSDADDGVFTEHANNEFELHVTQKHVNEKTILHGDSVILGQNNHTFINTNINNLEGESPLQPQINAKINYNTCCPTVSNSSSKLRLILVLGTYITAMIVPDVQQLISLVGALVGSLVALIIPPILELHDVLGNNHRTSCAALLRYANLALGLLVASIGTVASLGDIIQSILRDFGL
eukprot:CAMPEP_0184858310 /NCGR_PEP_ID=MMETSP0580-20130426/3432_1 /TAXON_ID=1118495 /ORGANISM="Dactyliosolen fragilissimus" /LENGTH=512 /DNA_ID=CAMNT_0027354397 /DNA_START=166 /DNA_END=1704 /DNA_ORIENTATION=+